MKRKSLLIIFILLFIFIAFIYQAFIYKVKVEPNHSLIFTILSDNNMECGYVIIKVYNDNTYEYYDKFILSEPTNIGKYHYDANKVLNNLRNNNKGKHSYIVEDANGNTYTVAKNNKEIKKFLNSIFLQKFRANLNKCPN